MNAVNTAPWAHRESFGRLLFIVAMLGNAFFLFQLLRRRSPLLHSLFRDSPHGFAAGLHGFWLGAIVALPLAVAALAVAGYFVVAEFFWRQFLTSSFLVLIAVVLYGMMALWVQVLLQRLDLLHREQAQRLAPIPVPSAPGETTVAPPPRVDLAAHRRTDPRAARRAGDGAASGRPVAGLARRPAEPVGGRRLRALDRHRHRRRQGGDASPDGQPDYTSLIKHIAGLPPRRPGNNTPYLITGGRWRIIGTA